MIQSATRGPKTTKPAEGNIPTPLPASGINWLAVLLAASGTLFLTLLLSPGLRSDVGGVIVFLGEMDATGIRAWILSFGALAPLVYFLIMVGQVVASPIPAGPATLAGALTFGVWEGLALSMAGSVAGSAIVFLAARRWGAPLVMRLVGKELFHKYADKLDAKGWWLFAVLLLPFMPDDAVCALAGLSAIPFRRFLAVMVVGRLPGATLTALLASDGITGSTATWLAIGAFVAVSLALGFAYRKRIESWMLHGKDGK